MVRCSPGAAARLQRPAACLHGGGAARCGACAPTDIAGVKVDADYLGSAEDFAVGPFIFSRNYTLKDILQ